MISMRAEEAKRAAQMFQKRKEPDLADTDDMFFDAKEYHTSNKAVANILQASAAGANSSETTNQKNQNSAVLLGEGAQWGDDEEIDIDADINNDQDAQ